MTVSPPPHPSCGEYVCPGINPARLYPVQLASEWGALVVTVEHRFYGKSQPFGDLAVEHLRFLSSRQALNDLAVFTEWFRSTWIDQGQGGSRNNTWVTIGGSYPGAMAAWYRLKYPHLTAAAHSSSGVVQAILNFTGARCHQHPRQPLPAASLLPHRPLDAGPQPSTSRWPAALAPSARTPSVRPRSPSKPRWPRTPPAPRPPSRPRTCATATSSI